MSRQIMMEVNQVFLQTVLTTTCSLQCPVPKVTLTISFRPLSIFQHTSYVSHTNRMWLSISVRPCHSLPQARWTQRPNVSVNGKGPLSIINDFFILYAYRWPIYVGFLLDQARDNLLFVERFYDVCTERLFTDNSLSEKLPNMNIGIFSTVRYESMDNLMNLTLWSLWTKWEKRIKIAPRTTGEDSRK